MFFIINSAQEIIKMTNGVPQFINMNQDQTQILELTINKRDNIRWYFQADMGSELYVCTQSDEAQCKTSFVFKQNGMSWNHTTIEMNNKLFTNPSIYFLVIAKTKQQINLTAHSALEISENSNFQQSNETKPEFKQNTRTIAYFVGQQQNITIGVTTVKQLTLDFQFQWYDGNQFGSNKTVIQQMVFTDNQSMLKQLHTQELGYVAGWLYIYLNTTDDYSINVSVPSWTINNKNVTINQKSFPLYESEIYAQIKYKPDNSVQSLLVSAFTPDSSNLGNVFISASSYNYPDSYYYDKQGNAVNCTGVEAELSGLTLDKNNFPNLTDSSKFKNCQDNLCTLFVIISFRQDVYQMVQQRNFYNTEPIYSTFIINATYFDKLPSSQHIDLNSGNGRETYGVFNQYKSTESIIRYSNNQGYVYFIENAKVQNATANALVSLNNISDAAGVSFVRLNQTSQAIVTSDVNEYHYQSNGMYFIHARTRDEDGQFILGSHPIFKAEENSFVNIQQLLQGQTIHFYANVTKMKRYQFCFGTKQKSNITIYASNRYYSPNAENKNSIDFKSATDVFTEGEFTSQCVTGFPQNNKLAYFTVHFNGSAGDEGKATFGIPYHFLPSTLFDVQTNFMYMNTNEYYHLLLPPHSMSTKKSIFERKVYFEINFNQPPETGEYNLVISEPDSHNTLYSKTISNVSYISAEINIPVDLPLLVKLTFKDKVSFNGDMFFGYIYDQPTAYVGLLNNTQQPLIFKVIIEKFHSPILNFRKSDIDGVSLNSLMYYICVDQPRLNVKDMHAHECTVYNFTKQNYESITLSEDIHKSQPTVGQKYERMYEGTYYITILPKSDLQGIKKIEFEYLIATPLTTNRHNYFRLQTDPLTSALGLLNDSWFVMDMLLQNHKNQKMQYYVDLGTTAQLICITLDQPITIKQVMEDTSKNISSCVNNVTNSSKLNGYIIGDEKYTYRRLYINILGNQDMIRDFTHCYVASFWVAEQTSNITYKLNSNGGRSSDDVFNVMIQPNGTDIVKIANRIRATTAEYKKMMDNGTSNKTIIYISDQVVFNPDTSRVDDAITLQLLQYLVNSSQKEVYIRVEASQYVDENTTFELFIRDNATTNSYQLHYMYPIYQNDLEQNKIHYFNFKAAHAPVQVHIELCEAEQNATFDLYQCAMSLYPDNSTNSHVEQIRIDQRSTTNITFTLPSKNSVDPQKYSNTNFQLGIESSSKHSIKLLAEIGSTKPVRPRDAEMFVDKKNGQFEMTFRGSTIQEFQRYDSKINIHTIVGNNTVSYQIYSFNQQDLPKNAMLQTMCGIQKFAHPVTNKNVMEGHSTHEQITTEFNMTDEVNEHTRFILTASNDNSGETTIYPIVGFREVQGNRVDAVSISFGVIFGVLGIIAIVLLVLWFVKLKKERDEKIYNQLKVDL